MRLLHMNPANTTQATTPAQTFLQRFREDHKGATAAVTADSLSAGWEKRTIREALDELARELGVRERIYAKWVLDNKHTVSDASDRMQRMIKAASVLDAICKDPGLLGVIETHLGAGEQV